MCVQRERARALSDLSFYEDTNSIGSKPHCYLLLITSLEAPSLNIATLGVKASTYAFRRDTDIQSPTDTIANGIIFLIPFQTIFSGFKN